MSDGCEWYRDNSGGCGHYDDDNFTSNSICCGCGGGETCLETNEGALNIEGKDCSWYIDNPLSCGDDFDTEGFCSKVFCCTCGGGTRYAGVDQCKEDEDDDGTCDQFDFACLIEQALESESEA